MNDQLSIFDYESAIKAEQQVLASAFFDPVRMDDIVQILTHEDFHSERHSLIFRALKQIYSKSIPLDITTVVDALNRRGQLEQAGGVSYLSDISRGAPTGGHAVHYANIVMNYSLQRKCVRLADDIMQIAKERDYETAEECYAAIDSMVNQLRPKTTGNMRTFDDTEQEYEQFLNTKDDLIKTGFNQFDDQFGGIGRGWLYIMAGRPSVGKTAKALQMAYQIAQQNCGDILFWSQEMTFSQLKNRIMSNLTGISFAKIRMKNLTDEEKQTIMKAHKLVGQYPFKVEDSHGITVEHIRSVARQTKRKSGKVGAIFVDYLTRMHIPSRAGMTRAQVVGDVAKTFKYIAQEMECPVILLAQLNREGAEGEPQLHHLKESGDIEQEADVVEFLWKEPDQNDTSNGVIVNSSVAKGRDTGTGTFKYRFKGWVMRYEDELERLAPNGDGFITNHRSSRRRNGSA